jgi:voltage-gated potassium channel
MKIQQADFDVIDSSRKRTKVNAFFDSAIMTVITLSVITIIAGSDHDIYVHFRKPFTVFELFSIVVFTLEYILRVWTAPLKYPSSAFPRIKYIFSIAAIIDLASILPFYIPFFVHLDLRFLRVLRLFNLLRVLKLNRYIKSLNMIARVLRNEKEKVISTIVITFFLLIIASSMMYYFENSVQPEKFPNILAAVWWAVATLTTVGYGDVYPITVWGKLLSGIIAILGIGLVALPSGIISSGFINEMSADNKSNHRIKTAKKKQRKKALHKK